MVVEVPISLICFPRAGSEVDVCAIRQHQKGGEILSLGHRSVAARLGGVCPSCILCGLASAVDGAVPP